jgi:hypothetical protein
MVRREGIPAIALCPVCKAPVRPVDISTLVEKLGYRLAKGSYVLECHGFQLTIDDPVLAKQLLDLLLDYYAENPNLASP